MRLVRQAVDRKPGINEVEAVVGKGKGRGARQLKADIRESGALFPCLPQPRFARVDADHICADVCPREFNERHSPAEADFENAAGG